MKKLLLMLVIFAILGCDKNSKITIQNDTRGLILSDIYYRNQFIMSDIYPQSSKTLELSYQEFRHKQFYNHYSPIEMKMIGSNGAASVITLEKYTVIREKKNIFSVEGGHTKIVIHDSTEVHTLE